MKKHIILIFAIIFVSIVSINCQAQQTTVNQSTKIGQKQLVPGEQAPPADLGQNNFGGPRPSVGAGGAARPINRQPRP